MIEDVLSLPDVQGVAISVLEAESPGIADKMKDLQNAGKVVIAIDSDGQKDARRAYIGTNNRKAGEVAGKVAKTLRPQGGKTAVFVGHGRCRQCQGTPRGVLRRSGEILRRRSRSSRIGPTTPGPNPTSRRRSASILTPASSWDSGRTTPISSPKRSAKFPEIRKKATVVTFDLDELAVDDLAKARSTRRSARTPTRWATSASGS